MKRPPRVIKLMIPALLCGACALSSAQTCDHDAAVNARSCFGAKGDVQRPRHCSMSAGAPRLTCSDASFVSADVGKTVYVQEAGNSGASLSSTIKAVVSTSQVTLANDAASTVNDISALYATDDTAALQNAYNYAVAHGYALYIPSGGGGYLHHGLRFTGKGMRIFGDAYGGTDLFAMAVTNPGKINQDAPPVGVDISGAGYNQISNLAFWGSMPSWSDLAPTINVLGGRSGKAGAAFAIAHIFESDYFGTSGTYNVALYGYEQSDFHNCHFETDKVVTKGNLYLSFANTPHFISPYVNLMSPAASMTKVNVSGARTVFGGTGKMLVLDQGSSESDYSISIRDAYIHMQNDSVFLSDTGSGPLRHIVLDTIYAEVGAANVAMVKVNGPAWNWRIENAQIYNGKGLTISPYTFAHGFLDGEVMIDSAGQTAGYRNPEFDSPSCAGSVLHLGQQQPTASCRNYALMNTISGSTAGASARGSGLDGSAQSSSSNWLEPSTWSAAGPRNILHVSTDLAGGQMFLANSEGVREILAALGNRVADADMPGASEREGDRSAIEEVKSATTEESHLAVSVDAGISVRVMPYEDGFYQVHVSNGEDKETSGKPALTLTNSTSTTRSFSNRDALQEKSSPGHATCWKATGAIGYCSSAMDATGACTCN
jgi:hypothetical protein